MSRARRQARDEARGERIVRRIVLTHTVEKGKKPTTQIDLGRLPFPLAIALLREVANKLEARRAEPKPELTPAEKDSPDSPHSPEGQSSPLANLAEP